jgi:hypothetical protein
MALSLSSATEVAMVDLRFTNGTFLIPLTNEIPSRILTIKDIYGANSSSTLTLQMQGTDAFEDGTTSKALTGGFGSITLYAGQPGYWYTLGGSYIANANIGTLSTGSITSPLRIGSLSTLTSINFNGLFGNYNNTVLAEISTGAGIQEFLIFKGSSTSDRVRVQTTGNFIIETGVSARLFNSNTTQTLSNATPAFIINTSSNVGIQTATPGATLDVAGTGRFQQVSTLNLNVSSINGQSVGGGGAVSIPLNLSTAALFTSSLTTSTMFALQTSTLQSYTSSAVITVGVVSSMTTNTITIGSGLGWIFTSPIQTAAVSTNTLWSDITYVNTENVTTGNISSVVTNTLTIGTGGGWLLTSPIQTSIVSSIYSFASQPYFDTVNVGSVSTMNSLEYYGLFGNYNNTVLAEISTGAGSQELLMFKGSSINDRVRIQTTGNFIVETGVSARLFASNTSQTLPNTTPAFVVNSNSNVGIQTNPAAGIALDVAGTGRFQALSTVALFASSIVAPYVFAPQFFTF